MKNDRIPPFGGGQGRSPESVEADGTSFFWLCAIIICVSFWIWLLSVIVP